MTDLHALNAVGEGVERAIDLLFRPFNLRFWLKLALIVFLVEGGLGSAFNSRFYEFESSEELMQYLPVFAGIFLFIMALILLFSLLSSVTTFSFLEAAVNKEINVLESINANLGRGFRLFLFNLLLMVATFAVVLVLLLPLFFILMGSIRGLGHPLLLIGYVAFALVMFLLVLITSSVIGVFTKDFVVPIMYSQKEGVMHSWEKLLSVIKKNRKQFLVYLIARILLALVTGILSLIILLVIMIFVIVAAFIIGLGLGFVGAAVGFTQITAVFGAIKSSIPLLTLGVLILIAAFLSFTYFLTAITLPVPVFFRYYSLCFLGKIDEDLNLTKDAGNPKTEAKKPKGDESMNLRKDTGQSKTEAKKTKKGASKKSKPAAKNKKAPTELFVEVDKK